MLLIHEVYNHNNINSYYVDGVSITRGSPRQHVWTLMAGLDSSDGTTVHVTTPPGGTQQVHHLLELITFVSQEILTIPGQMILTLYTKDPLWDGKGCGTQRNCLLFSSRSSMVSQRLW